MRFPICTALLALVGLPLAAHAAQPARCDFDGDGLSDAVVIRNADGVMRWMVQQSATGDPLMFDWGANGESLACTDADGDGKSDAMIWRASTGTFWTRLTAGGMQVQPWGSIGDDPMVIGDYDGDGQTDAAVFRSTTGTYWILQSTGGVSIQKWGQDGDFPQVMPDYDGDGKTDLGVQRSNLFWTKESTGAIRILNWGIGTDVHNSGDYDGDGKSDITVVRSVSGAMRWWIRSSESQTTLSQFGSGFAWGLGATDLPAAADYDGDGHTDLGVFRSGVFWILNPVSGAVSIRSWGVNGDYPLVNSFWK